MIYFSKASLPGWIFVTVTIGIMASLQLFDVTALRYQLDWFSSGEYWRILTGHWIHLNWTHLALNAAGLLLLIAIATPRWPTSHWIVYNLILALGISILFTFINQRLGWYSGYSGVLFGLYFLAADDLYSREKLIALLLGATITIKVILEQTSDLKINTSELIGSPVIIDAHLYGLLLGISIAITQRAYTIGYQRLKTNA
jgi:rhomboid family GlyGly-CTERM serine protease